MTFKAKCAKCGKEIELQDHLKDYIEKKPEAARCIDCYKAEAKEKQQQQQQTRQQFKSTATTKVPGATELPVEEVPPEVFAKKLRKAYDCVTAEFSDVIDEVKDYIGGWTSTIVINQEKKVYFKKK